MKAKTGLSLRVTCDGMLDGTFFRRKARSGGMTISQAKRLTGPKDETAKLKKLQAERMLVEIAMKVLLSKKWSGAP